MAKGAKPEGDTSKRISSTLSIVHAIQFHPLLDTFERSLLLGIALMSDSGPIVEDSVFQCTASLQSVSKRSNLAKDHAKTLKDRLVKANLLDFKTDQGNKRTRMIVNVEHIYRLSEECTKLTAEELDRFRAEFRGGLGKRGPKGGRRKPQLQENIQSMQDAISRTPHDCPSKEELERQVAILEEQLEAGASVDAEPSVNRLTEGTHSQNGTGPRPFEPV